MSGQCIRMCMIAMLAVGGVACEREAEQPAKRGDRDDTSRATPAEWKVEPSATGSVRGVVTLRGAPPRPQRVEGAKCHSGAVDLMVSTVSVDAQGRLRDAVVFVKNAPPADVDGNAMESAVLDQVNCRYVPAVVALRTGQTLRVTSSDDTLHNVHMTPTVNPGENFGFTASRQSRDVSFKAPESFAVKCDVHPWMRADVHVFDHPYYAVVDDAGAFEIKGLPAGEHLLIVRHGFLGDVEVPVTVVAGQTVDMTATFGRQ